MLPTLFLTAIGVAFGSVAQAVALGTSCKAPLGAGSAAPGDPFWMQNIKHQGIAAFNPDPKTYQVFRNVKDFGAKGDGVTDDTAVLRSPWVTDAKEASPCAIRRRTCFKFAGVKISNRWYRITPALVFFPQGTYLVSAPIVALYYTQLIGDARNPPTLLAPSTFNGIAVIDVDPYIPGGNGAEYYTNQNNFFRSVRNLKIDISQIPAVTQQGDIPRGIHWQVSQSTSLMNIVINLSTAAGNQHQGDYPAVAAKTSHSCCRSLDGKRKRWLHGRSYHQWGQGKLACPSETNSNTFLQLFAAVSLTPFRFTVRNVTVNNAQTAISGTWNWGWTYQGVNINNCGIGFDLATGSTSAAQAVSAEAIIDATVTNTPIFVRTSTASNGQLIGAGSLVLNNIKLSNVPTAVGVIDGTVVLAGGTTTITSWARGNVYKGSSSTGTFTQGTLAAPPKPSVLLDSAGKIFGKGHPQYASYAVSEFVSVRDHGAKGDGKTDDTAALQAVFNAYAGCKIIFFDAGTYVVTKTLKIPAGTQVVGEIWSVIAGKGAAFQDQSHPQVVVQVGAPGSTGVMEITDIVFSTIGPTPGAIVVEWNVKQKTAGGAGMWDSHIRLGGAAGTNLETNCPTDGSGGINNCYAAFLGLHLTASSTAYLEGTWVWLADHDLDGTGNPMISLYSGRGILSESAGPVWMIGTASEHHAIYQYNLVGAKNHYMGLIQTETPYYQPTPAPPSPFSINSVFHDPSFNGVSSSWGLNVVKCSNILIFGAGLYSFYSNYEEACLTPVNCQNQIVNIDSTSSVYIYSLQTVGTTFQLSVNEAGVVNQANNANGFAQTVTSWTH
ncbi:Exo-beta-1,3-glucanase [Mycena sanguinolenta]|uniref:Exo-beta-1,3-glucanase n=1 Tax=Mycena sanguinolenta TaxID=230812 RepID=A0A8H6YIP6_9AGAR|nr:Exo-beta-1,3-glucanase [Mycena sanguinolenta]